MSRCLRAGPRNAGLGSDDTHMARLQTQWHVVVVWRLTSFLCCACRGSLPCRTAWRRRARPARASAGWPPAPAPPPQTAPPPALRPCTPAQRTRTAVLTNASCLMTETYPDSAADSAAHPSTPAPQADDSCQVLQRRKLQSQAPCGGCDDSDVRNTIVRCPDRGVGLFKIGIADMSWGFCFQLEAHQLEVLDGSLLHAAMEVEAVAPQVCIGITAVQYTRHR